MGELKEWKLLLKRIGALIRKGISIYVSKLEQKIEKHKKEV